MFLKYVLITHVPRCKFQVVLWGNFFLLAKENEKSAENKFEM
jgi:hypothetical protein